MVSSPRIVFLGYVCSTSNVVSSYRTSILVLSCGSLSVAPRFMHVAVRVHLSTSGKPGVNSRAIRLCCGPYWNLSE